MDEGDPGLLAVTPVFGASSRAHPSGGWQVGDKGHVRCDQHGVEHHRCSTWRRDSHTICHFLSRRCGKINWGAGLGCIKADPSPLYARAIISDPCQPITSSTAPFIKRSR